MLLYIVEQYFKWKIKLKYAVVCCECDLELNGTGCMKCSNIHDNEFITTQNVYVCSPKGITDVYI